MLRKVKIFLFAILAVFSVGYFAFSNTIEVEAVSDEIDVLVAVDGACSLTHYDCVSGNSVINSDNEDNYTWTCEGLNGGTDASCSQDKYTLNVSSPNGTISGSGFSCTNNTGICSQKIGKGESVSLSASPSAGYSFSSWGGCDSTNGNLCTLTINQNPESVSASFSKSTYILTVNVSGEGSVSGGGITNCKTSSCTSTLNTNTSVSLTASSDSGYSFSGWSGDCTGTGTCSFSMTEDKTVDATFAQVGTLSGGINALPCSVSAGNSSCDATINWNVYNYDSSSNSAVTTPDNITVGTGHSGTATYHDLSLAEGNRNFFLYNSGQQDYLATDYAYAYCESGTTNVSNTCIVQVQRYAISFNANGGIGTMSNQTFTEGVYQSLNLNRFTRTGYTFAGWATSSSGQKVYDDGQSITVNSSMTLYALWNQTTSTYTVSFNANGGTGTMSPQPFTAGVSQNLKSNDFTRISYTFAGWATSSSGPKIYNDGDSITVNSNMTLYALWTQSSSCTITALVSRGRAGSISPTSISIPCGQQTSFQITPEDGWCLTSVSSISGCGTGGILSPTSPTRSSYTYTTPSINQSCTLSASMSECKTLIFTSVDKCYIDPTYAIVNSSWLFPERKTFTVTPYENNYISSISGCGGSIKSGDVNSQITYETGKLSSSSSDCTVTAICQSKAFVVSFNANGGTGTMGNQTFLSGVPQNLNSNRFSNTGYTFVGWGKSQGVSVDYTENQSVTINSNTTLYAIWVPEPKSLNVTVNGSGSVSSVPSGISCESDCFEGYTYGTEIVLTATPSPGHSFSSWQGDCSGIGTCSLTMDENHNVTANFIDSSVTPTSLVHNTTPNTSVPFGYTISGSLSPSECRLLDYGYEPLTEYQTNNPILQTSPSSSGNYGYYIECRNKNNYSIKAVSSNIIVNVVVVSVSLPTNIGSGSPSEPYRFTFVPSSLPITPETLNQASCQLLNNDKTGILVNWTPVVLNTNNSLSYNLPGSLGSFGYYVRCRNNVVTTATSDSEMIVVSTSCQQGQVLDPSSGYCVEPSLSVTNCLIPNGGESCETTVGWNIHQVSGIWAITTNYPEDNSTVANINSPSGEENYLIPYGETPFFLYNNGGEISRKTASADCRTGTEWDNEKLKCLAPVSSINVEGCTISLDGNSCTTSVAWQVENNPQNNEFTFIYPDNQKVTGTGGNIDPIIMGYGENIFIIKDGDEIILERRIVVDCVDNTDYIDGKCVLSSPEVISFKAEPNVIFREGSSKISWSFNPELVDYCKLSSKLKIEEEQEILEESNIRDREGSKEVNPSGTTVYYLDCCRQEAEGEVCAGRKEAIVSVIDMIIEEK